MRIAIIGPGYPFRGGISHYTSCLCKSLEKKGHAVKLFSFSRLYPSIIFPGKSQHDISSGKKIAYPSTSSIDSVNPFSWLKTFRLIRQFKPDIALFQWWTPLFFLVYSALSILINNLTRVKVIYLCHNVCPHEKILSNKAILKLAFASPGRFIVHSEEDRKKLLELARNKPVKTSPHPTYEHFNYKPLSMQEARRKLGLTSKFVLLFFGYIKGYKGLIYLIRALAFLPKSLDLTLLVVGEFYENKDHYINEIRKLNVEDKVKIVDSYVPNEDVGLYFSASDIVVCPYISATQSGIIQIAYGFEKPVIASRVGGLPEVVIEGKTGYLVPKCSPKAIAEAIEKFSLLNGDEFRANIRKIKHRFTWECMIETIESFASQ